MNCTFSDDSFCINTYNFFFLNATLNNGINLHGKLQHSNGYHPCTIQLNPITKTLLVKPKHNHLTTQQDLENALKPYTRDLTTYCSEIIKKHIIFEDNNKLETFLKIQYTLPEVFHFDNTRIPDDSCIEYIYGLKDDLLEQFFMEKGIKGPCWLQIEIYSSGTLLPCSEIRCHPDNINLLKNCDRISIPPLQVVFFDILNIPAKNAKVEPMILGITKAIYDKDMFNIISTKIYIANKALLEQITKNNKDAEICNHSKDLLDKLCETLHQPTDVIICPNKVQFFSCSNLYYLQFKDIIENHPVIDLLQFARDFFPELLPTTENLFKHFLNTTAPSLNQERLTKIVQLSSTMNVLSTYLFICNLTGIQLIDLPNCGQLKRVENLLKHELRHLSIVLPEKHDSSRPFKDIIYGGEILEPSIGYTKDIVVAYDFKSLYPNVIREYNLCFFDGGDLILPKLMDRLLDQREVISRYETDAKQVATISSFLKTMANSIVGCLSSEYSIFYQPRLANLVTKHGRMLLNKMANEIRYKLEGTVIYGHTDSVYVEIFGCVNYQEVFQKARDYQEQVNTRFKYVRLKLEGIFCHAVIFSKHQYALKYHPNYPKRLRSLLKGQQVEANKWVVKGVFKKNTPKICHNLFRYFLERIVVRQPRYTRTNDFIQHINVQFKSDNIEDYVIHVQLKQWASSYTTDTPYGNIVQRNILKSCSSYQQYDFVSYVICCDGTRNNYTKRAYDLNEVKLLNLAIDKSYYKSQHVFGLVEKINAVAPQYLNFYTIQNFLMPKQMSLMDLQVALREPYQDIQVLAFHFQCLKCWKFVVLNSGYKYTHFVCCVECKELFSWPAQGDDISKRVEDVILALKEKLEHMRRLVEIRGVDSELFAKVRGQLVRLEVQFYKQLILWREVFVVSKLGLESLTMGDLLVMEHGSLEGHLKRLFDDLLDMIASALGWLSIGNLERDGVNLGDLFGE